ncbi:hypothetical protein Agabi119p4_4191 [Agaricus bisporus var. burnettii]|uniref:Uncharacterized protein n=1 Tax=Agaricus bisporus var. burnettii TaxID=192524 RepID=A0A8H7F2S9_AGABI|nr:hypothetical protein Agabi119p4_4191 [Agaricus bisporus var. burnettii]
MCAMASLVSSAQRCFSSSNTSTCFSIRDSLVMFRSPLVGRLRGLAPHHICSSCVLGIAEREDDYRSVILKIGKCNQNTGQSNIVPTTPITPRASRQTCI